MQNILKRTEDLLRLRNYSYKTIKSYLYYIKEYIVFAKSRKITDKQESVEQFLLDKQNKKQSSQTVNLVVTHL